MTLDFGPRMEEVLRRINHAKRVSKATGVGIGKALGMAGSGVGDLFRGRKRLTVLHLLQISYATGFDPAWLACCDLDLVNGETPAEDGRLVIDPARSVEIPVAKEIKETVKLACGGRRTG